MMYHGRYHFIMGILFLVFVGAFIREAIREYRSTRVAVGADSPTFSLVYRDALVGATMMDGGEPVPPQAPKTDQTALRS
jgi:hypothetical protein